MYRLKFFEPLLFLSVLFLIALMFRGNYEGVHYLNYGFLGGRLSDLPILLRFGFHIGYVVGGAVLYFFFLKNILTLEFLERASIHLVVASVFSNFLEKVFFGNVFDFIPLGYSHYYCNVADLGFVLGSLLLLSHVGARFFLQRKNYDKRQSIFAGSLIQIKLFFAISFVFLGFFISVIFLLSLIYKDITSFTLVVGTYFFLSECILFCILVHLTNRIIGPVKAFIRYGLSNDRTRAFSLRDNDEFIELEAIANELTDRRQQK